MIEATGLTAEGQDLVLTGEGCFDTSSLRGKVVSGLARRAQAAGVPCVVLAGRTEVGDRQRAAQGVDAAYSLVELVGVERALRAPAEALATLAEGVAREWGV